MQPFLLAAVLIVFGLSLRSRAAGPATNPADLEREAVRRIEAVPRPQEADDTAAAPLTPAVRQYLDACRPALATLRRAATMPAAQYPPIAGDVTPLLQGLNAPRGAANVLRLAARVDADAGRPADAADDLLTGIALGRHLGQERLWVARLVEVGIECACIDGLAARLSTLPDDVVAALLARLDALPPAATLADTVDAEQAFGRLEVRRQARGTANRPAEDALLAQTFDAAAPLYDVARRSAALSPDAFAQAIDAAAAKLMANPYALTLAPAFRLLRGTLAIPEAKRAMLRAAIDARLHGRATLATARDPFGDGPFALSPTATGYRLTGVLRPRKDAPPVVLDVGG